MAFPRAEPANSRCSGRVQPGAAALMAWCLHESGCKGARNLGIYNCRAIRGSHNRSIHGDGRAIDVGFPGHSNPEGWKLVERLLPHVGKLGIQRIIWARRIWDAKAPAGRHYSGAADHFDHVHIELTWAAARGLNLPTIRAAMRGVAPAPPAPALPSTVPQVEPPPDPEPEPTGRKPMWLVRIRPQDARNDFERDAVWVTDGLTARRWIPKRDPHLQTQTLLQRAANLPTEVIPVSRVWLEQFPWLNKDQDPRR